MRAAPAGGPARNYSWRLLAAEAANIHVTFLWNHKGTKFTKNDSSEGILKDTQLTSPLDLALLLLRDLRAFVPSWFKEHTVFVNMLRIPRAFGHLTRFCREVVNRPD